jgi:hypothetical protein
MTPLKVTSSAGASKKAPTERPKAFAVIPAKPQQAGGVRGRRAKPAAASPTAAEEWLRMRPSAGDRETEGYV